MPQIIVAIVQWPLHIMQGLLQNEALITSPEVPRLLQEKRTIASTN